MPTTLYIDDISELPEVFASIEEDFQAIDFQPVMATELEYLSDWHRGLFDRQVSPDGSAWAPNALSTIKQKGHSQVLRGIRRQRETSQKGVRRAGRFARFRLSNSLTLKSKQSTGDAIREAVNNGDGAAMAFGTTVPYSVFNEDRPHVGVDSGYVDEMAERVADYAVQQLAKG